MTEDAIRGALLSLDKKMDDVRDRVSRIEERQAAAKEATEHSRTNAKMALDGLGAKIDKLGAQAVKVEGDVLLLAEKHDGLQVRVVKVEDAQKVLDARVHSAAMKGGGVGGGIGFGIGTALWLFAQPL
ncbi:MAG TPA: hypothetical protein VM434_20360, partial [Beijerinckiaceae bacterium]|nr:hypothetical protein [Beijerinckiaceae bacterium]